jgi:fumarate hydratase class I
VKVNLNQPMSEILAQLSQYPVSTRLSLNGTIIVARDIAHAKLKELIDNGEALPQYVKDHPIYYAGPAKTPEGYASGSSARPPQAAWTPTLICCSPTARA